jgi:hypothetical protein
MQIDIETPFRQQIFIYDIKTATYQQITEAAHEKH